MTQDLPKFSPEEISRYSNLMFNIFICRNQIQEAKEQLVTLAQSLSNEPTANELQEAEALAKQLMVELAEYKSRFLNLIVSNHYPSEDIVGFDAAYAAWEFLTAEADLPLTELKSIEEAMLSSPSDCFPANVNKASFRDKISLMSSGSQLFGHFWDSLQIGDLPIILPFPTKQIETVDQRRSEFGLESLLEMACVHVVPNAPGPVLLPAAYALNLVELQPTSEISKTTEATNIPSLLQPDEKWAGIPEELLLRRARYSQHVATFEQLYSENEAALDLQALRDALTLMNQTARDNLNYLVTLTLSLGFPTNLKVGSLAAEAAVTISLADSGADGQSLQKLFRSAVAAYKDNQMVSKPSKSDLAFLGDLAGFKATGIQVFGTCWVSPQQTRRVILPAPLTDIETIDQRRAEVGLAPWYEHALDQQAKHNVEALLPLEYFLTLVD